MQLRSTKKDPGALSAKARERRAIAAA